jgi:hypothetical protein
MDMESGARLGVRIVHYEPWQAELLGRTFYVGADPAFRFCYGDGFSAERMTRYFDGFVRGLAAAGGIIFATVGPDGKPDRRLVLAWRQGNTPLPDKFRDQMEATFDKEGLKRHRWLRANSDVDFSAFRIRSGDKPLLLQEMMRPNIMAVDPRWQDQNLGGPILVDTLRYFDSLGRETPYLVASTARIARFHNRVLGFNWTRELRAEDYRDGPIPGGCSGLLAVVMHRKGQPAMEVEYGK